MRPGMAWRPAVTLRMSRASGGRASWSCVLADERAEPRKRIIRLGVRHRELAAAAIPFRLDPVVRLEAGDVDLAAQSRRKLLRLCRRADERARRQRLAILQHDFQQRPVRTLDA